MTIQDKIQTDIINTSLDFFKTERFGYIDGTVRLGKIRISIEIFKKGFVFHETILLCYPDNKIKDSWLNDFNKWDYNNPNITFCNFSSLHKYKDKIFGLVVIDEFNQCSENERDILHIIITNDKKTKCLGLSGTVSKETKSEWGLKEIVKYTTEQAINDGIIADYQITVHLVDLDTKIKTKNKKGKFLTEKQKYDNYGYVINTMKKDGANFMHLALARNRLSLSSIGKIEYTKKLIASLQDKKVIIFTGLSEVADSLGVPSYHSKSDSNSNFLEFQNGKIDKLALASMGKSGVTYPNLNSVILLNFVYNPEETTQQLGRCLKLDYSSKVADLHIVALNEEPELKKLKETLSMLDQKKIKYEKN